MAIHGDTLIQIYNYIVQDDEEHTLLCEFVRVMSFDGHGGSNRKIGFRVYARIPTNKQTQTHTHTKSNEMRRIAGACALVHAVALCCVVVTTRDESLYLQVH